ncbi:hypothetical protein [Rhodanobacter sp. A1T4]|uniref:hypothetical protein n=1 Tax=Rhodanobacter sp. A1T4 TaxID=2723087 RepID=UPI001610A8D5|nr:hypothetical protein [Rhodanobacter sp. A1T4]MBB6246975.1 hypothetical protein [Rhodanobacter sp. A1T4]
MPYRVRFTVKLWLRAATCVLATPVAALAATDLPAPATGSTPEAPPLFAAMALGNQ